MTVDVVYCYRVKFIYEDQHCKATFRSLLSANQFHARLVRIGVPIEGIELVPVTATYATGLKT